MGGCNNSGNDKRRQRHEVQEKMGEIATKETEKNPNIQEKNNSENNNNTDSKNNNTNDISMINNSNKDNQNDKEMNFYLICPNCLDRSPHIEKLYYDENSKDFLVKYTCICLENTNIPKETKFMDILSNKEPSNCCNKHMGNKLIGFCKDCHKAFCNICKSEEHNIHNLEDINNNISKEEADNMLKIIKLKEEQFNNEINQNEQKMEKGIDNMIQKLNMDKQNYKKQLENYKDNNKKTFDFLKNLYERYINNFQKQKNNDLNKNNSIVNQDNNINNDIMLGNHINKFIIKDKYIPKLDSNVDEIIGQFNDNQKELQLKYDYGFPNIDGMTQEIKTEENNKPEQSSVLRSNNKNIYQPQKGIFCTQTFTGHNEKVVSLIELNSGKIASGSYDNTIRIWNLVTSKEEKIINEKGRVFALLEFEDSKLLCGTSNNEINLWDLNSDDEECLFSFKGHQLWINCLVKCNNNYFASASNDSNIKIWDYYNRRLIRTLNGHEDCVLSLIILKNNNLCSGAADSNIKIWDWQKGNCVKTLSGHEKWVKSVFELDNEIIISGSDDKKIMVWKDYELMKVLNGHEHSVRTFCQLNRNYFASGSFDCSIKIWDINTWKCVHTIVGHESNIIGIISLNKRNNEYNSCSFASCSNDKSIKIWEANF